MGAWCGGELGVAAGLWCAAAWDWPFVPDAATLALSWGGVGGAIGVPAALLARALAGRRVRRSRPHIRVKGRGGV